MSIKMYLILVHILSSLGCMYLISKYHFDDYVMHNWMGHKNYILSDLFAVLLACTPILNYFIVQFFLTYKFFDACLVFNPERRKRFDNNVANLVIKFLEDSGQSIIYPFVSIVGACGWIFGFGLANGFAHKFLSIFPAIAWAQIINRFL